MVTGTEGKGTALNTKLNITHLFFELQTPDFAWKFVWTVQTKYKSTKVKKVQKSKKVLITQPFFSYRSQILHGNSYGLSNQMTKYNKCKKYKNTTNDKNEKKI